MVLPGHLLPVRSWVCCPRWHQQCLVDHRFPSPVSGTAVLVSAAKGPCSQQACFLSLVSKATLPLWPSADLPVLPEFQRQDFCSILVCTVDGGLPGICVQICTPLLDAEVDPPKSRLCSCCLLCAWAPGMTQPTATVQWSHASLLCRRCDSPTLPSVSSLCGPQHLPSPHLMQAPGLRGALVARCPLSRKHNSQSFPIQDSQSCGRAHLPFPFLVEGSGKAYK